MKTLHISYTAFVIEDNGHTTYGDAGFDIPMADDIADRLLDHGQSGCAVSTIERILQSVELLRGRHYTKGSIGSYDEVKH